MGLNDFWEAVSFLEFMTIAVLDPCPFAMHLLLLTETFLKATLGVIAAVNKDWSRKSSLALFLCLLYIIGLFQKTTSKVLNSIIILGFTIKSKIEAIDLNDTKT